MLKVKLIDGSFKEVEENALVVSVAKELSPSLAKKACVAKLDGVLVDLKTPITKDSSLELVMFDSKEAFEVINHSCAHLLAQAMQRLYPGTTCGVGPAIEEGFYYDFGVNGVVTVDEKQLAAK